MKKDKFSFLQVWNKYFVTFLSFKQVQWKSSFQVLLLQFLLKLRYRLGIWNERSHCNDTIFLFVNFGSDPISSLECTLNSSSHNFDTQSHTDYISKLYEATDQKRTPAIPGDLKDDFCGMRSLRIRLIIHTLWNEIPVSCQNLSSRSRQGWVNFTK